MEDYNPVLSTKITERLMLSLIEHYPPTYHGGKVDNEGSTACSWEFVGFGIHLLVRNLKKRQKIIIESLRI